MQFSVKEREKLELALISAPEVKAEEWLKGGRMVFTGPSKGSHKYSAYS